MGRRSDHSREEIREMALQASASIIEEQGFQGLTARKVASKIGYTVGTLYLVFKNLDDLIVNVNTRTVAELKEELQQAVADADDPKGRLQAMAHAYIQFALDHRNRWRSVFEHRLAAGAEAPAEMLTMTASVFDLVGQNLKPLAADQREETLSGYATAFWSGVHGICILALTEKLELGSSRSLFELADILMLNFLAGLSGS